MVQPMDPKRCPLCQADNACELERGAGSCWCFSLDIPQGVLERVPEEARGLACVCKRCAIGQRAAAAEPATTGQRR
ncbi:MAG: cysteine-rich CWC family protein [Thermoanaerobaculia bacterium]